MISSHFNLPKLVLTIVIYIENICDQFCILCIFTDFIIKDFYLENSYSSLFSEKLYGCEYLELMSGRVKESVSVLCTLTYST